MNPFFAASVDPLMAIPGLMIYGPFVLIGVVWLLFPFFLLSRLNEIVRRLKAIEGEVEGVNRNTKPPAKAGEKPAGESSLNYHFGR